MSRRGHGEGSIYKEPSGLWAATIELGRGPDGKRRRQKVRAKEKREVLAKIEAIRSNAARGLPTPNAKRTVSSYVDWWSDNVLPGTVKENTADGYRWMLAKHVVPRVGTVPLLHLGPEHVLSMLRDMEAAGLSSSTRRQARAVLSRVLRDALRLEFVHRNAAQLVDAPARGPQKPHDALELDDAKAILAAAAQDPLGPLAQLVLTYGMRKGEALGLRWSDIDFNAETITIAGTLKRRKGGGSYVDTPKSEKSKRLLELTPAVARSLRKLKKTQTASRLAAGQAWQHHDWVFTTPIGTCLDDRNVTRWWHALCENAEVAPHRFHCTRHTAATIMLDQGVPLEVISRILGHSSVAITADVYARPSTAAIKNASLAMDRAFGAG